MALVELYRVTGERRYLDLARALHRPARPRAARRGPVRRAATGRTTLPVREAPAVAGHAVRQLYLDCGAVDVAVETGDERAARRGPPALARHGRDAHATSPAALGSRHRDEAFGDPFELPPDRAYAETCAAIASVMLAWRLLLATGDPACADVIERTIYNGVLSGALDSTGTSFFYVNPLQRRTHRARPPTRRRASASRGTPCACCPPNLMRTLASWPQLLATTDDDGRPGPPVRVGRCPGRCG